MIVCDRLTDYQIAEAFGTTLSLIYKDKMQEINDDLSEAELHFMKIAIPQIPRWQQEFAQLAVGDFVRQRLTARDHINKIRRMYKKIKNSPESEPLDVQKAKSIPIENLYEFRKKGNNVSCPFHGEDRHASASLKYNRLVCFTCGLRLDAIAFVQKINNMKFKEAVEYLNKL